MHFPNGEYPFLLLLLIMNDFLWARTNSESYFEGNFMPNCWQQTLRNFLGFLLMEHLLSQNLLFGSNGLIGSICNNCFCALESTQTPLRPL